MDINYTDIGNRIKDKRLQLKITQEKLAETTGLSVQHLSGIENGKTRFSFATLVRIVNALGVSIDELACGSLMRGKPVMQSEFSELLADCSPDQTAVIIDTIKAMKKSMKLNQASE